MAGRVTLGRGTTLGRVIGRVATPDPGRVIVGMPAPPPGRTEMVGPDVVGRGRVTVAAPVEIWGREIMGAAPVTDGRPTVGREMVAGLDTVGARGGT
jgi:hypothetical protein